MWGLFLVAGTMAQPSADTLRLTWESHAPAIQAHSPVPLLLESRDFARLARGKPVTRRAEGDEGTFATGAIWIDMPVQAPWIVISDAPCAPPSPVLVERLPTDEPVGERTVYHHMDLPWPLADRQWVGHFHPNLDLLADDPDFWQRIRTVVDPALAPEPDPDAVWVRQNTGAWTMLIHDEGTLVVFSVHSDLGGHIPAGISQEFALLGLAHALERLAETSRTVPEHYDADHERLPAPDGRMIPAGLLP